jgi:uncharacterized protein YgiM (DUF1202 family)
MKRYLNSGLLLGSGIVLCFLLGPANLVKAEPAAPPQEVVEVTAKKLNIRTGPGLTNPEIHTLSKGDKLVVLDDKDGWLKVKLPASVPCWIHKKYLDVKGESQGLIRGSQVRVRSMPETGDDNVVGYLAEGDSVTLVKTKDDWHKIVPPESFSGWLSKKYTRYWGTYERYLEMLTAEAQKQQEAAITKTTNEGKFQKAEELYLKELTKPDLQQDFREALALYQDVAETAPETELGKKSKDRISSIEPREKILSAYRDIMREGTRKKSDIDKACNEELIKLLQPKPTQPVYDAEGWVEAVGKLYRRPSAYKLTKGGEDICFIRVAPSVNMDEFYQKHIGICGKFVKDPNWNLKIIVVDKIDVLSEN